MLRRSLPAHRITSSPRHGASPSTMGVRSWGQSRRALVTPELRLLTQLGHGASYQFVAMVLNFVGGYGICRFFVEY